MALAGSSIFECNASATSGNVNSGGFNPANANMLTDGAATSATGSSPVFSSASYNFVAGDVGHRVFIQSGTNWVPGWYLIASVASNQATLTASIGGAELYNTTQLQINLNTVAGCATTASPTAAAWTIDYSRTTSSPFTGTDLTGATTTCTSVTNPFGKNMVGNIIHLNTTGTGGTIGFYEIVSVSTITATLDRTAGTTFSGVTYHTGGALSLGSSDDAIFELATNSATASTRFFVKGNATYTLGGTVTIAAAGNIDWPACIIGYNANRSDNPTDSSRPIFAVGAVIFTFSSNYWNFYSVQLTGTGTEVINFLGIGRLQNLKVTNSSATAGRFAIQVQSTTMVVSCECISYRGPAFTDISGSGTMVSDCYFHDSDIGYFPNGSGASIIINCIIADNVTAAVTLNSNEPNFALQGCTLYGAENKLGSGVTNTASGTTVGDFRNNLIYGFVTGLSGSQVQAGIITDYNNYFNNTTNINSATDFQAGAHDTALDPQFTNVKQITGSTATTTSGNHLVQSGATFITSGVVAGQDFVYIKSGTGITAGKYGILSVDSETQITTDITLTANATANKVWQITTGHNFAIGTNLKAKGYPGVFPGGLTTGYTDIGAVQRQEPGATGGGSFTFS